MKRIMLMLSIAVAAAFVFGACNKEETADLAWKNESASSAAINEIVWAAGNETWTKETTGYVDGETTESKEVDELTGNVTCTIYDSGDFRPATIEINGSADPTLSLNDGESYVYTINASPAK